MLTAQREKYNIISFYLFGCQLAKNLLPPSDGETE